jgi:hypothetical protein
MWYSDIATAMAPTSQRSTFALGAVACFSSDLIGVDGMAISVKAPPQDMPLNAKRGRLGRPRCGSDDPRQAYIAPASL